MPERIYPHLTFEPYNPSNKERDIILDVYQRRDRMKESRSAEEERWNKWEDLYTSYTEPKGDFRSTINPPITFSVIETALTEIIDQRVKFQLKAKNIDYEENQEVLEDIVRHVWDKSNGDIEYFKIVKDMLIYGTSIGKILYYKDIRNVRDITNVKIDKNGKERKTYAERLIVEYDDVKWEHISMRDFFVDEVATSLDNARDCIERHIYDIHEFRRTYSTWPNAMKVMYGGDTYDPAIARGEGGNSIGKTDDEVSNSTSRVDKRDSAEQLVEVLEYWNKPLDRHIVVANGVLIFDEPIPYVHKNLPYFRALDTMVPDEFYGIGEAEILQHYHEEMKQLRRMRLDNVHLSVHQMFITDQAFEEDELYTEPGKLIHIDRGGQLVPIQFPALSQDSAQEYEQLRKDTEDATGINRQLLGAQASAATTATEITFLKEASLKRIRLKLRIFEAEAMKRLGRFLVQTIQQYYRMPIFQIDPATGKKMEKPRTIRTQGENGRVEYQEITEDKLRFEGEVEVIPGSTLPLSRGHKLKTLIDLYPILEKNSMSAIGQDGQPIPGEEPLISKDVLMRTLISEAELPPDLLVSKGKAGDLTGNDIMKEINSGKPTEEELRGKLGEQMKMQQMQGDVQGPMQEGQAPQQLLPPEAMQQGMIPSPPQQQEQSADEVAPPDVAAAEDHLTRILMGEEPMVEVGYLTPRHIDVHERDLEDPMSELAQAEPNMRRQFEAHVEQEKDILRQQLETVEL